MTDAEWVACTDTGRMLTFLCGRASDRKLMLFALACCARISNWFVNRSRLAVNVMDQYLEGLATDEELIAAGRAAFEEWMEEMGSNRASSATYGLYHSTPARANGWSAASICAAEAADAIRIEAQKGFPVSPIPGGVTPAGRWEGEAAWRAECAAQCRLIRDIFHGPLRPVFFRQHWLRWNDGTVRSVAEVIYKERDFSLMPILADALEDAGCDQADILNHCRQPNEHVRGCWVVDLLLGKA